jgi:hypothetical protein
MRGHGLMQAIARVNRVFKDKPGGLVVDYLGLADELKQALATYTESGGTGQTAIDQAEGVAVMLEKYEICLGMFHGFDLSPLKQGTAQQRISMIPAGQEFILAQERGKERLLQAVKELSEAFALAVPDDEALRIRDAVGFFQAVRAALLKHIPDNRKPPELLDHAVRQIVSKALVSDEIVDIFAAAGLKRPDISILSDDFLAEIRGMPQRNLAVELLRKLLVGEIKTRSQRNVVQARSFTELLERSIRRYQNRAVETAQVVEELIALARDMRAANARGEDLGLSEDELAFYDALEANDSAVKVLGEPTNLEDDRPRAGRDGAQERDDRLDRARERPRSNARACQANIAQIRLSARQTGEGDSNGLGAGGTALRSLGRRLTRSENSHNGEEFRGLGKYPLFLFRIIRRILRPLCAVEAGLVPGRVQDRTFVGNVVQALEAYGSGVLGPAEIPLQAVDRIIAIGSDGMMNAVAEARRARLKHYLRQDHRAIASINSPMQCMIKEICAQCLQLQRDPQTGTETVVFSCFNQDQEMDRVDFPALHRRLSQNSVQEKLNKLWIDRCLQHLGARPAMAAE